MQIDWLRDLLSETGFGSAMTRRILNDGLNCVMTVNSGNLQSDSRHLRLRYHLIHEAIVKGKFKIKYMAGTEILADSLTKALGGVKLGEFVEDIGLR